MLRTRKLEDLPCNWGVPWEQVSECECYQINTNMLHNFSQVPPKEGNQLSFPFQGRFSSFLWKKKLNLKFPLEEDDVNACVSYGYQHEFHFHTLG